MPISGIYSISSVRLQSSVVFRELGFVGHCTAWHGLTSPRISQIRDPVTVNMISTNLFRFHYV